MGNRIRIHRSLLCTSGREIERRQRRQSEIVKKPQKKKKPKPRLPIAAVLRLRSHPVTTEKGKKGYERKNIRQQTKEIIEEDESL